MLQDVASLGHVIAANVRAERGRRHWRQADLAEKMGWAANTVGHLEIGRRDVRADDIPLLCRAFGITIEQLTFGANPDDLKAMGMEQGYPRPGK
jgi:transcriptional regulator with XRE-family HTH domain